MSTHAPIFPQQHFTDYGFDPQIDYLQVLEEAKWNHTDSLNSKPGRSKCSDKINRSEKRWWRRTLVFFKWRKRVSRGSEVGVRSRESVTSGGPVYIIESRSGSTTPNRTTASRNRPKSGPIAGSMTPTNKGGGNETPYTSLEMEEEGVARGMFSMPEPIYLIT